MATVKRVVLDVLKPHHPGALEFARALAAAGRGYRVTLSVEERDEQTESVLIMVQGEDVDLEAIAEAIAALGGSVHSVDEVEVLGAP